MLLRAAASIVLTAGLTVAAMAPAPPVVRDKVALQAVPFPLADVRLLDGPFKQAQRLDAEYLLSLEPDRLLHTFRINAGLPSSAAPLGGWEAPDVEAARPHRRSLPVGARADVGRDGRHSLQVAHGSHGRRARHDPGRARETVSPWLPVGVPGGILRPRRSAAEGVGAVLHDSQDHGRPARRA